MRRESHIAHTVRVLLQALSFEHANTKRLNAENDSLPVRLIRSNNTIVFTEYLVHILYTSAQFLSSSNHNFFANCNSKLRT